MSKLVPDSRGRHALLALLDEKNQTELEEATGLGQPALSLIKSRKRRPGRESAGKLAALGIEYAWWDEPPTPEQLERAEERKREEAPESSRTDATEPLNGTDGARS